jgi:putative exporter of polyketide antibiotics
MQKGSIMFLKLVIALIGIVVLALIGAVTITVVSDRGGLFLPILIIMYATAVPFFVALYQAFKLLGFIDTDNTFSESSVVALKKIKYCAIVVSVLYAVGMPLLVYVADKDDAPGVVGFGVVIVFSSIVTATFAAVLQKLVQSAVDIKSENDLTV